MQIVRKEAVKGERDDLMGALKAKIMTLAMLPKSHTWQTKRGMLVGRREEGKARTASGPHESVYHHAGYLSGHLLGWLARRGRSVDGPLRMIAAGYAASLADPGGQKMLERADRPITAHNYAAIRVERTTGRPLSEIDERMLFEWLLEQTDTQCTDTITATAQRQRLRRQERLQFDGLA
jgi:hypothetical protein